MILMISTMMMIRHDDSRLLSLIDIIYTFSLKLTSTTCLLSTYTMLMSYKTVSITQDGCLLYPA